MVDGPSVKAGADQFRAIEEAARLIGVAPTKMVVPMQVHGSRVITGQLPYFPLRPEADGLIIREPGAVGMLRFADCIPVIFGHPSSNWVVGLHSGYAGTVANICSKALSKVDEALTPDWNGVTGWIGPSVCGKCYERRLDDPLTVVGMDRLPSDCHRIAGERVFFDLKKAVISQLSSKMDISNILVYPGCTMEEPALKSYRRDATQERMILLFGLGNPPNLS
ncbi:MAG: polyphenol oxidase family protein [Thermanaerothrix sp.]|nr:polyphenol oxidase family protein [Thermanaerothrix sp.]